MTMETFVSKTVTDRIELPRAKAKPATCTVTRTRNSTGYCSVELRIESSVVLTITNEAYSDYEQVVRQIAEQLLRIADEPCLLEPIRESKHVR